MKVDVTAQGLDAESLVDPRFGGEPHFCVAEVELRDSPAVLAIQ